VRALGLFRDFSTLTVDKNSAVVGLKLAMPKMGKNMVFAHFWAILRESCHSGRILARFWPESGQKWAISRWLAPKKGHFWASFLDCRWISAKFARLCKKSGDFFKKGQISAIFKPGAHFHKLYQGFISEPTVQQ